MSSVCCSAGSERAPSQLVVADILKQKTVDKGFLLECKQLYAVIENWP